MRVWMCSALWLAMASGCASNPGAGSPTFERNSVAIDGQPAAWVAEAIAGDGPGDQPLAAAPAAWQVQNLPKSNRGNPREYTVGGERYSVLDTAVGFVEQGKASWYGRKFHGRETSSGEVYDMYQMTAAHKHLPIPTFVRVTRTDTGDSIVVKVNDRGPFVPGRVIDLSFQAASTLGILETGTAPVIVEALSSHLPSNSLKTAAVQSTGTTAPAVATQSQTQPQLGSSGGTSGAAVQQVSSVPQYVSGNYLQLGAFSDVSNAQNLIGKLSAETTTPLHINQDASRELYRVWVGPFKNVDDHNAAVASLQAQGIVNFTMVPSWR